jgi:hypothetical protein
MVDAVRLISNPEHTGVLLPAVGAAGVWKIVTETVPAGLRAQPGTNAVTEYVPFANVLTFPIVGFLVTEV